MNCQRKEKIIESKDAKPIDFTYMDIKLIQDIIGKETRQGKRLPIPPDWGKDKKDEKALDEDKDGKDSRALQQNNQKPDPKKGEKKPQIRLVPQQNSAMVFQNFYNKQGNKIAEEQNRKQIKKKAEVKLVCCSLLLGYNKLRSVKSLPKTIKYVMYEPQALAWIDLSHNYIEDLDYDFQQFPNLSTLYLHCSLQLLSHLPKIRSLTVHGNPIVQIPNFRLHVIGLIPQLKNIDSVLITKKEVDNAIYFTSGPKYKPPKIQHPVQPPKETQSDADGKAA